MAQTTASNTTPTLSQEKKVKGGVGKKKEMHCRYLLENRNERERRQRTLNRRTVDCSAATLLGERWRYLSSWTRDVNVNKIVTSRKKKKKKKVVV
jgi:hypothetical protein